MQELLFQNSIKIYLKYFFNEVGQNFCLERMLKMLNI